MAPFQGTSFKLAVDRWQIGLLPHFPFQTGNLLFSVVKQVVLEGIWQWEAQDPLAEEVHWRIRLGGFPRGPLRSLPPLLFQVLTASVVGGVGNTTSEDLLVQKHDRFHSPAADSPSLEPGRALQSIGALAGRFLANGLLDGAADGDAGQVLQAAHGGRRCKEERQGGAAEP